MTYNSVFAIAGPEMAKAALADFLREIGVGYLDCEVDIQPAPHRPRSLPVGKMAVYCFDL